MNKLIDLVIGMKKYYENNRNRIGSGASLFAATTENAFMVAKKKAACVSQTLMKKNPLSLYIWCKKWHDSGQLQLLAKA
jgi:hypothetical protein